MKVKNLKLNNFAKFTDFEIEYDRNITRLVGINGSGKTTAGITGIWATLKGIAEKGKGGQLIGERFRFIGPKKSSADLELILVDEKQGNAEITVKNHITASSNKITFEPPEGYLVKEGWLENLLAVALMSAKNFSQLTAKAQALALGIDTTKYDEQIVSVKAEYKDLNRDHRGLGDTPHADMVECVSILDLVQEKDKIDRTNREYAANRGELEANQQAQATAENLVDVFSGKLEAAKADLKKISQIVERAPDVPVDIPTEKIVEQIANAEETNAAAAAWEKAKEIREKKAALLGALEKNKKEQGFLQAQRTKYIKGALAVDVEGLEVDETGGLVLHDKPIREPYFSKGELEVAVARIYAATNPELKIRFLDDFDVLDEANQSEIIVDLLEAGFQIITAETKRSDSEGGVVELRECKKEVAHV